MLVQDILKKLKGEIVTVASGEITSVGKVSKGTGQYGAWTLQPATLKDSTGEISVTFSNCREILKGEHITIRSVESKKGWNGIKMDVYKDKPQIKVTESAQINVWDDSEGKDTTSAPTTPQNANKPPSTPIVAGTDWSKRNPQTDRGMLISYVLEHLVKPGLAPANLPSVKDWVDGLFALQYQIQEDTEQKKTDSDIPFGE